ncbi:hypothetical protein OAI06_03990, partial [Schleiferiaceae bacterium]|nr:hypothetical protein [Schleiferiaceae bacterium]
MKTLFRTLFTALALVFFVQNASASHNAGGDLHYEYVSSTGNSHKYKIYMRLYRDNTGITLPTSATIYACSANYATVSTTLTETTPSTSGSGVVAPTLFDCVSSSNAGVTIHVVTYEGEITLPGN